MKALSRTVQFILIWCLVLLIARIFQYFSFGTNTFDLSIFDYAFFNTMKGEIFYEPFHGIYASHFGVHFTPSLLVLLPLYAIFRHPLFLMLVQVIAVGGSAYFLYRIVCAFLSEFQVFLVISAYLLFRPLISGVMYDFHPIAFFPLLLFCLIHQFITKGRIWLRVLLWVLILGLKEDLSLYLTLFAVVVFFKFSKKGGIAFFISSLVYFLLTYIFIQPSFYHGEGFYLFSHWSHLGGSLGEVAFNLIRNPFRIFAFDWSGMSFLKTLNYLAPLLFIPLLSPLSLSAIAIAYIVLITSSETQMHSLALHFSFYLLPFLFYSFSGGLKVLKKRFGGRALTYILLAILLINIANSSLWEHLSHGKYSGLHQYKYLKAIETELLKRKDETIFIQSSIIPTLKKDNRYRMLGKSLPEGIILINPELNTWPLNKEGSYRIIKEHTVIAKEGDFYIISNKPDIDTAL
ncbi:DUF2079 domain-containing protein [bacterium]|nr:DUF2079 domain-containing protein [bacterium]